MPIQPGDRLSQYEILEELGRGGMAAVFRARQAAMGRDVAVKVLPEQFLHDANFLARFTNEARVIAGLEHRGILPVYDYGEFGGTPFIVMRLMPHGSLRVRLRPGPLVQGHQAHQGAVAAGGQNLAGDLRVDGEVHATGLDQCLEIDSRCTQFEQHPQIGQRER